jgi:hypothetical protein
MKFHPLKPTPRRFFLRFASALALVALPLSLPLGEVTQASSEYFVYSVSRAIDLGNPGEAPPPKDFYVTIGTAQGIRKGSLLEVTRRTATYDLVNEKIYKDVTVPVGRLKVIHVEKNAAIARLDKLEPIESAPAALVRAVMVGDLVAPTSSRED